MTAAQSAARPPATIAVPAAILYAGASPGAVLTMIRILGLCGPDPQRTPACPPGRLAGLLHCSRATLYRHLDLLEKGLGWLRVERAGGELVLYPLLPRSGATPPGAGGDPSGTGPAAAPCPDPELERALRRAGIDPPALDQLARDPVLQPAWVEGWRLWTCHPLRAGLRNPPGLIVRRLRQRLPPPDDYLALARLEPGEWASLRAARWTGGYDLDGELARLLPLFQECNPGAGRRP